ncbi:hypothetical protein PBI_NAZO_59 [Mycobacterium phage Nazo]|uniref:Uncharacterized protein n=1 Tax=Mycobacterium phage Nazo TaxID=1897547 RepID=A0A1D8EV31_9CAUD|nr:hypothetical protein PBI_NAZO_59 [Mycobacterium phage Nazo]
MSDRIASTLADAFAAAGGSHSRYGHAALAQVALDALRAAPVAVVEVPEVAHKGPLDTEAKFFRQVAERMADPTKSINVLGGSNVREAVRALLVRVAEALEVEL